MNELPAGESFIQEIGQFLQEEAEKRGLSTAQIAAEMGKKATQVEYHFSGLSNMTLRSLVLIAGAMGARPVITFVSPDE